MSHAGFSLAAATVLVLLGGISPIGAQTSTISLRKTASPDPVIAGFSLTYTVIASNLGTFAFDSATLSDTLPPGTTFVSLARPAGWTCVTPDAGDPGTISCDASPFAVGHAVFFLVVQVSLELGGGTNIFNQAQLTAADDSGRTTMQVASATTRVAGPASVSGTKVVSGLSTRLPGSPLDYTVTLTNGGPSPQGDHPGDELTDVLPAGLTLLSATATSGTVLADVPSRTVTWNGAVFSGTPVTITIHARIDAGVAPGTVLSNQGTIAYDADGDGTNEATALTDDPQAPGTADPTSITVQGPDVFAVPTLDGVGLVLLTLLLAMGGALKLRRRRA